MSDDILVRIPLSGASQFHPLALAPGLPMLDTRKLTYQVLLGWFGDVLAEPELTEEGVLFHAQEGGRRQQIEDKALATTADLEGPLAGEFEQLKKALFEVRPVSPSERLIFNRLQPPIGNHDGYLYRVKSNDGDQRLVWCWGFQKRSSDAQAMICSSSDCAQLFLRQDATVKNCPRCEEPLIPKKSLPDRRSRIPLGAIAATAILGGLAAGTYWFPVLTGAHEASDLPIFPVSELGEATDIPGENVADPGPETEGEAFSNTTVDRRETASASRPERPVGPDPLEVISSFAGATGSETGVTTGTAPLPNTESPGGTGKPGSEAGSPLVLLPEPGPATEEPGGPAPTTSTDEGLPLETPSVELKPNGRLKWHRDYFTAYDEAAGAHHRLVILFLDEGSETVSTSRGGLEKADVEAVLGNVTRLHLPLDFRLTGSETPLLEHRSFRHLGGQPGVVIIELSDPKNPLFGQAVSALRLPAEGQFSVESLQRLLDLPTGSIGQRSLLFAIRSAVATSEPDSARLDSPLFNVSPNATLSDLANRNSRFMAHIGRVDLFETGRRQEILRRTFGNGVQIHELTFGTTEAMPIQEAAAQTVRNWTRDEKSAAALNEPATAYGLDLFQSPESGRWFATLILVE